MLVLSRLGSPFLTSQRLGALCWQVPVPRQASAVAGIPGRDAMVKARRWAARGPVRAPEAWYFHFASCFYINIYCIMGYYYTLYINTYGYSLLFYKVYHEEGECRQLVFWLEKEQILETYSAQLQKSRSSTKVIFGFNKNYWAKKVPEGAHTLARRVCSKYALVAIIKWLLLYFLVHDNCLLFML